jgi:hypothetical protein
MVMSTHANQISLATQVRWLPRHGETKQSAAMIRIEQTLSGHEGCFMTEKRLFCQEESCDLRGRCRRLVAVWKR